MEERKRAKRKNPRSNHPPLKAAMAPTMFPTTQPMMMAGSWSAMLQGSACAISVFTEAGYCANDVPRSPCSTLPT